MTKSYFIKIDRISDINTLAKYQELAENAVAMKDIEHNPYKITKEMVACSMGKLEKMK